MRRNSFDLVRLVAAALVLYGHSFVVLGFSQPIVFGGPVGNFGVAMFFATSGYLIAASWQADPRIGAFIWKRCLRILPALLPLAAVLAIAAQTGMFEGNPHTDLNVSLWTLPIEARCYLLVLVLGVFGAVRRPGVTLALYVAVTLLLAWEHQHEAFTALMTIGGWLTPRGSGMAFAAVMQATAFLGGMLMHHAPRRRSLAVLALVLLVARPGFPAWALAVPYLTVYIAESATVRVKHDLSYGLYIWGWPVQQLVVALGVSAAVAIFPLALAGTAALALGSWVAVERPALRLKTWPPSVSRRAEQPSQG